MNTRQPILRRRRLTGEAHRVRIPPGLSLRAAHARDAAGIQVFAAIQPALLLLGQGCRLAVVGVAIGLMLALVAARLMRGLLFHVSPSDPATFVSVAAALIGVAALASYVPARRATRVDPMIALRGE